MVMKFANAITVTIQHNIVNCHTNIDIKNYLILIGIGVR